MSAMPDVPVPQPLPAPVTYDAGGVAKLLSVSIRHVRRLDAQRLIPGRMTIGRLVRYRRDAVAAWVATGCPMPRRRS